MHKFISKIYTVMRLGQNGLVPGGMVMFLVGGYSDYYSQHVEQLIHV